MRRAAWCGASLVVLVVLSGCGAERDGTTTLERPRSTGRANLDGCALVPTDGLETIEFEVGSRPPVRTAEVYVPRTLDRLPPRARVPLVLNFHGLGGTGRGHAEGTGWMDLADDERFITVFPNDFQGKGWDLRRRSSDVAFARALVREVSSRYCVEERRIYASGYSYGGYFAQRLACDAPDLIASVTAYAAGRPDVATACRPSRAIAVGLFHGDADSVVRFQSGEEARDGWIARMSCDEDPKVEETRLGVVDVHDGCEGDVEVLWRVFDGQDHAWPTGRSRSDMLGRMWEFHEKHELPAR